MATESISDRHEHVRSIGVTSFAALVGVGTAIASSIITGDASAAAAATDLRALLIVVGAIVLQFPLIDALGIYDDDEFGIKHYLFIALMTFSLWFITWGILLTAEYTG